MLTRRTFVDGLVGYVSPRLLDVGVRHLFTTRHGGAVGDGRGHASAEIDGALLPRVAAALDASACTLVALRQVHGAAVLHARNVLARAGASVHAASTAAGRAPSAAPLPAGDGLVTDDPGHLLVVRTADCVPVLLASTDGAHVAAVHAGWRGLLAGVLPAALLALRAAGARDLVAAVGSCLSPARFEVGEDVADAFLRADLGDVVARAPSGRPCVDLRGAALRQLARGDVHEVDVSDRCTWTDAADFYSYRRDVTHGGAPRTGQLAALIAPAGPASRSSAVVRPPEESAS